MSTARGEFDGQDGDPRPTAAGLAWGRVAVPGAVSDLPVVFKIDTGSPFTILLDKDFLDVVQAITGPTGPRSIDEAVLWVRARPWLFKYAGRAWCVGGQTGPIYKINRAVLWLCNPDAIPPRKYRYLGPVHAAFSAPFLSRGPESDGRGLRSLLGRMTLNQIRTFSWNWRRRRIRLRGV